MNRDNEITKLSINEKGIEVSINVHKIESLGEKESEYKLNKTFEGDYRATYYETK